MNSDNICEFVKGLILYVIVGLMGFVIGIYFGSLNTYHTKQQAYSEVTEADRVFEKCVSLAKEVDICWAAEQSVRQVKESVYTTFNKEVVWNEDMQAHLATIEERLQTKQELTNAAMRAYNDYVADLGEDLPNDVVILEIVRDSKGVIQKRTK